MFEDVMDALEELDLNLPAGHYAFLKVYPSGEGEVMIQYPGASGPRESGSFSDSGEAVEVMKELTKEFQALDGVGR